MLCRDAFSTAADKIAQIWPLSLDFFLIKKSTHGFLKNNYYPQISAYLPINYCRLGMLFGGKLKYEFDLSKRVSSDWLYALFLFAYNYILIKYNRI